MERINKKSFWLKLFFSYLAILAFALAIGMFLFRSSLMRIEESTEKYSRISLSQVNESMSQMRQTIQALCDTLSIREEYHSLMYAEPELTSYKRERIAQLQKEMNRQVVHHNYVSAIYIWFVRPQLTASTRGMFKGQESMEQVLDENFGITMEQMEGWLEEGNGFFMRLLGNGEFATKAIAVTYGGRSNTGETPVIVMELRLSAWLDILSGGKEPAMEQDAVFWLESRDDSLHLASPGDYGLVKFISENQGDTGGSTRKVRYEDKDLMVMGMERDKSITIMSAWDYGTYTRTQKQYQHMAVLFLSAYLILGAFMAMVLTRLNYGPVQGLLNLILEKVNAASGDEFAVLETGINSLLKYSQDYEEAKAKEKVRLREKCLISMLLGEVERDEFSQLCGEHSLYFTSDRFAVAGIVICDSEHLFFDEKVFHNKRESLDIGYFTVKSVAEELLGQCGSAFACRHEAGIWVTVSPPWQENQDFHDRLMEQCRKAEIFLREQMGIGTRFYVSELSKAAQKSSGIHFAYENAKWGLEQIEGYNIQNAVNDCQSVEECIRPVSKAPRDDAGAIRRRLFSAVTAGDFEEADSLYLKLRRQDIEFSDRSFATVRAQSLLLVGYFVSFLTPEAEKKHHGEIQEYLRAFRSQQQDEGLMELMHQWMVYFRGVYQETKKEESQEGPRDFAADAAQYVNSHYSDTSLSVAQVADNLSISQSYLARSFQKRYDMNVLQYIHCRRIDMAMVLLRESSSTIEQIAEQVGYTSSLALIRAFKRYKGCTPTEYRNSLKEMVTP